MERDALRFAEADQDSGNTLSWVEFVEMQPTRVREKMGDEALRRWFLEADVNGDGEISMNEFFSWTLARQVHNGALHGTGPSTGPLM